MTDPPVRWKDCESIYPPEEEIVEALQDPGKNQQVKRKGRDVSIHRYPLIEKLAGKIFGFIQKEFKPDGLTKNSTRGKQPLLQEILLSRKHFDLSECPPAFHRFGKEGKVYLLTTSQTAGLEVAVDRFQDYVLHVTNQKNSARTSNDGLRLASIMLDSQCRGMVSGILSKKKNRTQSDIPGDPTTHAFEQLLNECFLNPSYVVELPPHYEDFPEDERSKWEPNDPAIFEHQRSGEWLRNTWDDYIKPKYKKALDRWNKDTGGGDGSPPSFIEFCGGDRWLVWVFCRDLQTNFLLASSAAGRMPSHLQVEAGFEGEDTSSVTGGGSDTTSSNPSMLKRTAEEELDESRKERKKYYSAIDRVVGILESKHRDGRTSPPMEKYLGQVAKYSQMMVDNAVLDTMSPTSKSLYVESLKRERKNVLEKMNEKESNADQMD
jgi:hypothetical protein